MNILADEERLLHNTSERPRIDCRGFGRIDVRGLPEKRKKGGFARKEIELCKSLKEKGLRGQYFSFDAIIGSIIFVLAIVMLLATWNSLRTSLDHQGTPPSLEALRIGDTLRGPGNPPAERCEDMETLGLAISWEDRRLNDSKLISCAELSRTSPEEFQQRLGSGYPASIFMNGIHVLGEDFRALQVQEVSRARRIASMYNSTRNAEEIVILDVYVYRS